MKRKIEDIKLTQYHISAAESYSNIKLNFNKKMSGGKVEKGEVTFIE